MVSEARSREHEGGTRGVGPGSRRATSARFGSIVTPLAGSHDGAPALLAQYAHLTAARRAIQQLEQHGVDGDDIALVGSAARALERGARRERSDSRVLSHAGLAIALGVLAGGALGALLGAALVGVAVLLWSNLDARAWVFGLMVAWFAAGGALLGAFAGVSRAIGFSESMAITYEGDPAAPPWLAVYGPRETLLPLVEATEPIEIGWSAHTTHASAATTRSGAAHSDVRG
jgi:hypothetical protein